MLYKLLGECGTPYNGGTGTWSQPIGKAPGEWMPEISPVVACRSGYHLCRAEYLLDWAAPELYIAEGRGETVEETNKIVFAEARLLSRVNAWNDQTLRLFACDCAERALKHWDNPDPRSVDVILVSRRFANGEASDDELVAARAAARDAARDAARAAAWAAAWAAARAAEQRWQLARIRHYLHKR